ncbi:hypothetical protein EV384_6352 [Micromonospora kangleipakensis]|uniref:Uncharacterized protein n=1 Tax=Micromonospora kangleipakensis TaxID=1077942 RepID=A0A4Q8BHT1_9ACTN|nr:hypothetical protein [Micromonospora kangleipakensis]RZU77620.1 hypothetical protein EV384_6352 [Micromonospora kangleipakensis]
MAQKKPAGWIADLQQSPDWAIETTREDAGWIITGRWWGEAGEPASDGPREVVIRLSDDAPRDVRQRGVNSGVMRRLERHLSDMGDEIREVSGATAFATKVLQHVEERVARLPDSPRKAGDVYYRELLDLFEEVIQMGYPEPLNILAKVMGIPKDTLKTRLRVARQRRGNF